MNQPKDLLSIGAFASLTRLSIKALRLYDQLGLLQPQHVDPQNSYRFYGVDQLSSARMIRNMREMDMPLTTIRQVLTALASSPAQAEALVLEYADLREQQAGQIRAQVQTFIRMIQQEKNPMTLEIDVKKIPAQQVVSITRHVKVDKLEATIQDTVAMLQSTLAGQNASTVDSPFGIYHGTINEQDDGPIEICIPFNGNIKAAGDAQVKQLEGGDAACVTLLGEQCAFPAVLAGYDVTAEWIQKNGYEIAEAPREVWHRPPGNDEKIEVVWLFK